MILYDEMVAEGVRILVRQGPVSLCAYVGVPDEHPWAGRDYGSIDIDVHGGLTFSEYGKDTNEWPKGWYWWGWDYAHGGDYVMGMLGNSYSHKWTLKEVIKEARAGAQELIRYMRENPCATDVCTPPPRPEGGKDDLYY